ncbi:MAG: hypothetical protein P8X79_13990 [Reinekea sp.]
MTETNMYLSWIKHLPSRDNEYAKCSCPECQSTGLKYQYFCFGSDEYGWKLIWCETCKSGIKVSRVKLPEEAVALVDETEHKLFLEAHSELKLVS